MPWPSKDPADYQGKGIPAYLRRRPPVSPWWVRVGVYLAVFLIVLLPSVLLAEADAFLMIVIANLLGQAAQWAADVLWRRSSARCPARGLSGRE